VLDDAALCFRGNRFNLIPDVERRIGTAPIPGLSFFDRRDQQYMIKVHLPYSWRTGAEDVLLFLPPLNRPNLGGPFVLAGVVEAAWYANPVNLVLELPPPPAAVHVRAGDPLAQVLVLTGRSVTPALSLLDPAGPAALEQLEAIRKWREDHARDRSAYKRRVRAGARPSSTERVAGTAGPGLPPPG